jgi:uncharacterized protein with von Willebrand factor type A (vWA) domain
MATEIRARLSEPPLDQTMDRVEDIDFLNASRAQSEDIRDAVRPLARRIATRLARDRRSRQDRGRVNFRRTARQSLSTGGVPLRVAHDRPRPQRPELFVLCDISGSVADFSVFTLTLMSALSAEVARTRSFVFADAIDEVSELLAATGHGIEPWQLMRNTNVIRNDGHSDYGAVLDQFWNDVADRDLRPSSIVIVTGDARSNYRQANASTLSRIAHRCRRLYWLNPEPRAHWNTHDSVIDRYAVHCSEVFEVRNLHQLSRAVGRIL